MKTRTRKRFNLIMGCCWIATLPVALYLLLFHTELWERIDVFVVLVISIETAAFTHFAAAAADTPMEGG